MVTARYPAPMLWLDTRQPDSSSPRTQTAHLPAPHSGHNCSSPPERHSQVAMHTHSLVCVQPGYSQARCSVTSPGDTVRASQAPRSPQSCLPAPIPSPRPNGDTAHVPWASRHGVGLTQHQGLIAPPVLPTWTDRSQGPSRITWPCSDRIEYL